MNAVTTQGEAAHVELAVPAETHAALSAHVSCGRRPVESAVSSALEGLAQDLGLTRSCSVEVRAADNTQVTISIDGKVCPYARRLASHPNALLGVLGQQWFSRTADLPTLLLQYARTGDAKSVAALLATFAVEAVNSSADLLLPLDAGETVTAEALRLTRKQGVVVGVDDVLQSVTSPSSAEAITEDYANSQAEALIARLAAGRWKVLINPQYLKELAFHQEEFSDFPEMREKLYSDLGVRLPRLTLSEDDSLGPHQFAFQAFGIRTPPYVGLPPGDMLLPAAADEATAFIPVGDKPAIVSTSPNGTGEVVGPIQLIAQALYQLAWDRAPALVTTTTTLDEVSRLGQMFPLLSDAADQLVPPWLLTRQRRYLVSEGIGVQDLRSIVQVVLDERIRGESMPDEYKLQWRMRVRLRSRVCAAAGRGAPRLMAHRLPESIAGWLRGGNEESTVAAAVRSWAAQLPDPDEPGTVVLTAADVRARLRSLLCKEFPRLPILADDEIASETELVIREPSGLA